ncbi:MAG: bifunctional folylpolyglutamate synthase/dihydrofolate synthase [Treponemataceae bacterium]|nr:bifunctional folylpolyglutamate synthase/dihydrofolate synthase [Treponemataceae bacterium]
MTNTTDIPALTWFEEWLDNYLNFERLPKKDIFWLDTVEFLCRLFNNPQDDIPCVHVAGSKGKGSVSAMISSILEAAGYPTGLYTSPHIISLAERIGRAHGPLPEAVYEAAVREMCHRVDAIIPETLPGQRDLTWFELITVFSFLCFRQAKLDWAVFETGLGGRLDATNVVHPRATVLTPIELEHVEFLGDTLEKIAGEKAGIIKPDTPAIVSFQHTGGESVKNVFKTQAEKLHAPITFIEDVTESLQWELPTSLEAASRGMKTTISFKSPLFTRPITAYLHLMGKVQAENAALAAYTAKCLVPDITEEQIEKGLEQALLPGRFELTATGTGTTLILDGAHTANSIQNTLETLQSLLAGDKEVMPEPHLLFACARDKNDAIMVHELLSPELFSQVTLTRPGELKSSDVEHLYQVTLKETADMLKAGKRTPTLYCSADYAETIRKAIAAAAEAHAPLLVTGSFYLVAETKKILEELR